MRSVSASLSSTATRDWRGPAVQTFNVWLPDSSEVSSEVVSPADERSGRPSSAFCTTVPESPSTWAFWTSTRSCSADFAGKVGSALAVGASTPVPPTTATTASGATQRSTGLFSKMLMLSLFSRTAVRTLSSSSCQAGAVRVLLVDDEERIVAALRRGLAAEGFVVNSAATGPDGLRQAASGDFDAVVLDVTLPGLSGYEVVRRLRAEDNWVPVLMLSAKDGPHDQADGLDYGADDYLTKPFDYVVLLARLRALLRRQSDPRPPVLSHHDVRLDPATREVTLGGEPVALSRREHELLEFFLRHPD